MKTLRYLLIVIAMVSFLGVNAQGLAQQPETQMHTTSIMVGSGSTLPSAAVQGTYVTGSIPGTYTPANAASGPSRAKKGGEEGDTPPSDPHGPMEDPIGDAGWPLALLALAYVCVRAFLKRKRACGNGE